MVFSVQKDKKWIGLNKQNIYKSKNRMGPGVRKNEWPLLARHTHRQNFIETSHNW